MPAFSSLSDEDVKAIVKYIRRWAPGKPYRYPVEPVRGDRERGKQLYAKYCAACHGPNGEGGKGTGVTFSRPRDLPIIPPALNNPGFLAAASDQFIKATLMNGREGTPMVSFLKQGLSEQDINDLVVFVRSFEDNPLPVEQRPIEAEAATIVYDSEYDFQTTINNLKDAAVGNNFIIIREQKLESGFVPPGQEDPKQHIIYFCNFGFLNKALAIDRGAEPAVHGNERDLSIHHRGCHPMSLRKPVLYLLLWLLAMPALAEDLLMARIPMTFPEAMLCSGWTSA